MGGDTRSRRNGGGELAGFNRRWRFLGGDTRQRLLPLLLLRFQSQVAILGWGYRTVPSVAEAISDVSIAGGDSWVGIPTTKRRVKESSNGFNRRWRFLGGDTTSTLRAARSTRSFQSQVAILGWGYIKRGAEFHWILDVSIAGGDSWVGIRRQMPTLARAKIVSIAGGDSWVGIHTSSRCAQSNPRKFQSQVAILGWGYP